jgi:hypothetical protein
MTEQDLDMGWIMNAEESGLNWTVTGTNDSSVVEMMGNGTDKDSVIIFLENPNEMLNPAMRNPIFYHILVTHIITFVVGIVGNLVAVFVMIGDRKSRNATNLFLVR